MKFQRGKDPKEAMGIGRETVAKWKARQIEYVEAKIRPRDAEDAVWELDYIERQIKKSHLALNNAVKRFKKHIKHYSNFKDVVIQHTVDVQSYNEKLVNIMAEDPEYFKDTITITDIKGDEHVVKISADAFMGRRVNWGRGYNCINIKVEEIL